MPEIEPLTVEFVGLPGAGKSFLARRLLSMLRESGRRVDLPTAAVDETVPGVRRLLRKGLFVAAETLAHPRRTARAVGRIRGGVARGSGGAVGRSVQWLVTGRLLASARRSGGVHLFEEGLLQGLWSIGIRGDVAPMLEHARDASLLRPDVVVVVDAPTALLRQRLEGRSSRHSRVQRVAVDSIDDELTKGGALLEEILAWWGTVAGARGVLRVTNGHNGQTTEALGEIAARIDREGRG